MNELASLIRLHCSCIQYLKYELQFSIQEILQVMFECCQLCINTIRSLAKPLYSFSSLRAIRNLLHSNIKFERISNNELRWAIESWVYLADHKKINKDTIFVKKLAGINTSNSICCLGGIAVHLSETNYQNMTNCMPWKKKNCKILIIKENIALIDNSSSVQIKKDSLYSYLQDKEKQEEYILKLFVDRLLEKNIGFLFCNGKIPNFCQQLLHESGIGFMESISDIDLYHLETVCNALSTVVYLVPNTSFHIDDIFIGEATIELQECCEHQQNLLISNRSSFSKSLFAIIKPQKMADSDNKIITLCIFGATKAHLNLSERKYWMLLHMLKNIAKEDMAISDDAEVEIACYFELQKLAEVIKDDNTQGIRYTIIRSYANILEYFINQKLSNYGATIDDCTRILQQYLERYRSDNINEDIISQLGPITAFLKSKDYEVPLCSARDLQGLQHAFRKAYELARLTLLTDSIIHPAEDTFHSR
jgi:chaperonin GroEL (HSP60 family)